MDEKILSNCLGRESAQERAVRFAVDGQMVHGALYLPEAAAKRSIPAVVVAHGLTGSRNSDARLLVWLSRALAASGLAALAIDFRGSGESEGDFAAMTPETEIADLRAALDFLTQLPEVDRARLGLAGHSLGGVACACASGDDTRVGAVALWSAVGDSRIFQGLFDHYGERQRRHGDICDAGGVELGPDFWPAALGLDIQARFRQGNCPALIAHGTADEVVPFAHAKLYDATAKAQGRAHLLLPIEGADHCYFRVEARLQLIGDTADFFARGLGA